jgi:CheY-like chemotaxis protein
MNIVHLEDIKPLRDILHATISTLNPGCQIKQFINGSDAIAFIGEHGHDVDLFLLDVRVPGAINGLEVAQAIRDNGCQGIVVMTSAYMAPDQNILNELNAYWYQKPWQISDVQEMLRLAASNRSQ